ncbi:MAG: dihydrodipicolinate synthase family protein [Candidatus Dormibacteraceae bacterium]
MTLDEALQGVIPPLITPLTEDGRLDEPGFLRQARRCLDAGCTGLFTSGSTGEGPWLDAAQRRRVVELAVGTGATTLAGVMLPGTRDTIGAALQAQEAGAQAVAVAAPYYFESGEAAIVRHVTAVADSIQVPIVLYNIPQMTHNPFTTGVVRALAEHPRVVGIKDSSGDRDLFRSYLTFAGDHGLRVLQGDESWMGDSLRAGADGLIPGTANVAPGVFVALRRAVAAGDRSAADRAEEAVAALMSLPAGTPYVAAVKSACATLDVCGPTPAAPGQVATEEQATRIGAVLSRLSLR